ncbi:hypothetical protein [Thiohalorhabdus sp.]|uniref:hypothetical protein n=1 Tax=Thiohalorhabdus sp. TaxID=3094134 RepID=UPI002FC3C23C
MAPHGSLDPMAIPGLPYLPARARLALIDRLYAAARPSDPQVLDRFINAYLLLAHRGFAQVPWLSPRRRALAQSTLRAVELMNNLFRTNWRQQMAGPETWWRRFLETFRAAGQARLLAIRRPLFQQRGPTTVLGAATTTLLHSAANPFAWEPELQPHLERLLGLLGEEALLFPAASPSAYVESGAGRFLFDANRGQPPVAPEILATSHIEEAEPNWWILDTNRVLGRLADLRRNLALSAPADRVPDVVLGIPEPSRSILIRRLEQFLTSRQRGPRIHSSGQAHLVSGLEQTVRHVFARRWRVTNDMTTLDTNVRLQSEMRTRSLNPSEPLAWQIRDRHSDGIGLRGPVPAGPPIVGRVAGIMELGDNRTQVGDGLRPGIIRWQRIQPDSGENDVGIDLFSERPMDCWCRIVHGPGATLREYPALFLEDKAGEEASLLLPPGLFRTGVPVTLRTDDREWPAEFLRILEMGVHFEHVAIRVKSQG